MKCPHCNQSHCVANWNITPLPFSLSEDNKSYFILSQVCQNPDCIKMIILQIMLSDSERECYELSNHIITGNKGIFLLPHLAEMAVVLWPSIANRSFNLPDELSHEYKRLLTQAKSLAKDFPGQSAVTSGRILELFLKNDMGINAGSKPTLGVLINVALKSHVLSKAHEESLEAIRDGRNMGGHAKQDKFDNLIEIDTVEAEYMIELIEGMLEEYIVQPVRKKTRNKSLQAKKQSSVK